MGSFDLNNGIRQRQVAEGKDPDSAEATRAREIEMFGGQICADEMLSTPSDK